MPFKRKCIIDTFHNINYSMIQVELHNAHMGSMQMLDHRQVSGPCLSLGSRSDDSRSSKSHQVKYI